MHVRLSFAVNVDGNDIDDVVVFTQIIQQTFLIDKRISETFHTLALLLECALQTRLLSCVLFKLVRNFQRDAQNNWQTCTHTIEYLPILKAHVAFNSDADRALSFAKGRTF